MESRTLLLNFHSGKIFSKALALLLFFTFFSALTAQSQTLDQENAQASNFGYTYLSSSQYLGQSFVAGQTGDFAEFHFLVGNYPGYFVAGDFQLNLYAGNGSGGTLLGTKNFTITTFPGANAEYTVVMPAGIAMVAGNTYTAELRGITGVIVPNVTNDTYTNGMLYGNNTPTTNLDLWFKTYITDPSASALNFDGINDRVSMPNQPVSNLTNFTLEAWVNTSQNTGGQTIYSEGNSSDNNPMFSLTKMPNTTGFEIVLRNEFGTGLVASTTGYVPLNTWTHVAFTRTSATTASLYINGVNTDNFTFADPGNIIVNVANIGVRQRIGFDGFFSGSIDEFRVWNRALGQCEIQNNMNGELPSGQSGLLAYYQFNQGVAAGNNTGVTSLTDSSGNNYNGTLTNFALNGATSNWSTPGGVTNGVTSPAYTEPNVNAVTSQSICNNSATTPIIFSSSTTGTVCGMTNEGGNITLTAPAGAVFTSIPFASYGTPDGTCGNYTIGWCHASNSVSIVSGLAIGQSNFSIGANNGTFGDPCNGTGKRLYIEAVYNNTAFNWTNDTPSIGLAASGTGSIPSFNAINTGSTPVVATITVTPMVNGCAGTPIQFTITVNPNPTEPTAVSQEFCDSATVADLIATGTNLNWYDVATNGTALSASTALITGTYYVTQTTANCESARTAVSVTITPSTSNATTVSACDSYTWAVNGTTYNASGIYSSVNGCHTETLDLTITPSTSNATTVAACDSYVWAVNGTTYNASGIYSSVNGCHTETLDLTINSATEVTGDGTQSFSVANLSEATIEDLVVSPINVTWYGSLADATADTNALPAGTQIVDGATYYAVNDENTCSSTPFAVTVAVTLGTDNFDVASFRYYPNPTSGMLTISYSKEISEITLINLLGQTLFTKKANALEVQIDLSSLPTATYLVNIVSEGQTKTIKVLKRE
nr:LamG-like jellyroll fold domain-containing protein [uncultured Flavobacterium sp.]